MIIYRSNLLPSIGSLTRLSVTKSKVFCSYSGLAVPALQGKFCLAADPETPTERCRAASWL